MFSLSQNKRKRITAKETRKRRKKPGKDTGRRLYKIDDANERRHRNTDKESDDGCPKQMRRERV